MMMRILNTLASSLAIALALSGGSTLSPAQQESEFLSGTTAQWWQNALSIPTSVNPLLDTTGQYCMLGQRDPMWFLAGNAFGVATARTCTVPAGETLFFPVISNVVFNSPGICQADVSYSVDELRAQIAPFIDSATNLNAKVDGKTVKGLMRIKSDVFATTLPADNLFNAPCIGAGLGTIPAGVYSPSVDDGYYVLIKPLSIGKHVLHIHAESQGFVLDVTYDLTVVPVQLK
jgi:hypothetical protein